MYLIIKSKNEIQVEALSLMGASTKRLENNKIGMFGTGNKYGIAYCMRNNYNLRIFSGKREIFLATKPTKLGDNDFDIITLNGKFTSLTTSLGKDWSLWMAIREFYSNAIDEGLIEFSITSDLPKKEKDTTTFFIETNAEIMKLWSNIDNHLSIKREVLFENEIGKIYVKKSQKGIIFREGILVKAGDYKTLFDFDLHNIDITEERLAKRDFQVIENMWKLIYSCDNEFVIRSYVDIGYSDCLENNISQTWYSTYPNLISDTWKKVLKEKQLANLAFRDYLDAEDVIKTTFLESRLYNDSVVILGDKIKKPAKLTISDKGQPFKEIMMTEYQQSEYDKAISLLAKAKFDIPYDIKVVDFRRRNQVGGVSGNTILLGVKNFDEGDHYIVNTILEEYIHIKHQVADETRGFQTASINELVSYMKLINNL